MSDRRDNRESRGRDPRDREADRDRDRIPRGRGGMEREREGRREGRMDRRGPLMGPDRRPFDRPSLRDNVRKPMAPILKPKPEIDRETTCPLLLRMFCKVGAHHTVEEFQNGKTPKDDELTMHTWLDATFKELMNLVREVTDEAKPRGTRFEFSVVYPTQKGTTVMKEVGVITVGQKNDVEKVCLGMTRFKIGDYID
eukprot:Ihof_evm3s390 gene=Ihof_evmTU3s390